MPSSTKQEEQRQPFAQGEDGSLGGDRGGRAVRRRPGLHDAPGLRVQPARQQRHPARLGVFVPVPGVARVIAA